MKKTIITLSAALALSACTQTVYRKPGATAEAQTLDFAECDYQARAATAGIDNAFMKAGEARDLRNRCMAVKGYDAARVPM